MRIESREHAFEMAAALREIAARVGIGLVYKTSFDKANRTSAKSARGIGLEAALPIFADIRATLGLPVLTDVHERDAVRAASPRRSTCCRSRRSSAGRPICWSRRRDRPVVNVKKGQFLAPWDMEQRRRQAHRCRQSQRAASPSAARRSATTRSSPTCARCRSWRETGAPVIFDATHTVQQPGGQGTASGGEREFVPLLARAAVAVGRRGLFIETHEDPGQRTVGRAEHGAAQTDGGAVAPFDRIRPAGQKLNAKKS